MSRLLLKVAAVGLSMMFIPSTFAQTAPAANTSATTPAEAKPPLSGKNSFTESQARERIQKAGYEDVKVLQLDTSGVWRADAMKSGQQVKVALDFRGNVVQQ